MQVGILLKYLSATLDNFHNISSPKENNCKDLGGEFVLLDESQKNVMQLLDQLGIGTEKVLPSRKSVIKTIQS